MDANFEKITFEKVSAASKWSNYDFKIYYNPADIDYVMKLNFIKVQKSTWYNYFAVSSLPPPFDS